MLSIIFSSLAAAFFFKVHVPFERTITNILFAGFITNALLMALSADYCNAIFRISCSMQCFWLYKRCFRIKTVVGTNGTNLTWKMVTIFFFQIQKCVAHNQCRKPIGNLPVKYWRTTVKQCTTKEYRYRYSLPLSYHLYFGMLRNENSEISSLSTANTDARFFILSIFKGDLIFFSQE